MIFFATLVALDLTDVDRRHALVGRRRRRCRCACSWPGCSGTAGRSSLASALQVALVAAGLVVPVMFFLGLVFAACGSSRSTSAARSSGCRPSVPPRVPGRTSSPGRVPAVTERTLVLIKPDAVRRGLVGEVLGALRAQGPGRSWRWTCARSTARPPTGTTPSTWTRTSTRRCGSSSPPGRWWRWCSRATRRSPWCAGSTGRPTAGSPPPGTIRGDLSLSNRENLVHASDSAESVGPRDHDLLPRTLTAPVRPSLAG